MGNIGNNMALQRVQELLDPNSFVEIGAQISARNTDYNLSSQKICSDGVITGYGQMDGRLVFLYSQNHAILNGTLGEMHCKKIAEVYRSAIKLGAPVIGILDSAGFRLQESCDALEGFGFILNELNRACGLIPSFCIIAGNCGGGLSLIPSLSDFTFMMKQEGKLYLNSPNTIPDNYEEKLNPSKGEYQEIYSGIVDFCGEYSQISKKIKEILDFIPSQVFGEPSFAKCQDDLNRSCEGFVPEAFDLNYFLQELSDDHFYLELKPAYAPEFFTGFLRLGGLSIGVIGNRTVLHEVNQTKEVPARLTARGLDKGSDFVTFCNRFSIPILCITDVVGFETSELAERTLAKEMGRFAKALLRADVAKVTLIPRQAYGSGYVLMNTKSIGADFVYAWQNSKIGSMESQKAEKILGAPLDNQVQKAAGRGYVDRILAPEESRRYLISAFDLLYTKNSIVKQKPQITN
ncbi:MAG: carboxyl transferase domain-containing protein [Lachnospiraceae bacterium]